MTTKTTGPNPLVSLVLIVGMALVVWVLFAPLAVFAWRHIALTLLVGACAIAWWRSRS